MNSTAVPLKVAGGVFLCVALAAWALFSRPEAPGATSTALALLAVVAAFAAGAAAAWWHPAVPGLVVGAAVVGAFLVTAPASLSGAPLAPPLGYANANAALLVAATGGLLAADRWVPVAYRPLVVGGALVTTAMCVLTLSFAATGACVVLLGFAAVRRHGSTALWQGIAGLLIAVPVLLTVLWATVLPPPPLVLGALSEARLTLWSEALDLVGEEPVRGVGAGAFAQHSPTARQDADLQWAHSAPLEVAAELGLVGLVLLVLLLAWGVVALRRDAMVLAAFVLPATVDYVFHFGAVLVASALVIGSAFGKGRRSQS